MPLRQKQLEQLEQLDLLNCANQLRQRPRLMHKHKHQRLLQFSRQLPHLQDKLMLELLQHQS